ncbi:MAG: hypothetical protein KAR57_05060 [Bacteroidales bacterium]|nr:hypothetical protein [Bacteroidales bacterium]
MIKKVLGIVAIAAIMVSCANKEQKKEACCDKDVTKVTVDQVMADMQAYVDKDIVIVGTVNHVCSHGGKRMFIMGEDPEVAIKITPSEEIGVFEKELEGSHVIVKGILKELRIDEAFVVNLEKEIAEGSDSEAIHDHSGGTHDETEEAKEEKKQQIDAMRKQISESENGYYSQFWVEASKFEVKECEHEHAEGEEVEAEEHEHEHAKSEEHEHEHEHKHEEGEEHTH